MRVKVNNLGEGHVVSRIFYDRIYKKNQNVLAVDIGGTGTGKSYRQLRIMEIWHRDYLKKPIKPEQICFEPYEVVKMLHGDTLKRGDILIYEEAGTSLGAKDFMERRQKMFNYIMQSFRFRNIILMFNLPNLMMLNKDLRRMLHLTFESVSIDYDKKINYCKPFKIQESSRLNKTYFHYPKRIIDGKQHKIKRLGYTLPSEDLIKMYEEKKRNFFNQLNTDVADALLFDKWKKKEKETRIGLTNTQLTYLKLFREGFSAKQIAEKYNITPKSVYDVAKSIKMKGYSINKEELLENPLPLPQTT